MKNLKFSEFTHVLRNGDITAFYNSLRLKPIFVDSQIVEKFNCFKNFMNVNEFLSTFEIEEQNEMNDLIAVLEENMILVQTSDTDEKEISIHLNSLGKPFLHILYFLLTDDCNFDCEYCFIIKPMNKQYSKKFMNVEIAQKGLDLFCENIKKDEEKFNLEKDIIFYGGEPLMNLPILKYLLEKITEYKELKKLPEKVKLSIITNGSLITPEIANFLKSYDVSVSISIDGEEKDNDKRVYKNGRKAFKDIIKGFKICKENGVNVNISCTLTTETVENFDNVINSLVNVYGVTEVGFNMLLTDKTTKLPNWYNQKASDFIVNAFKIFREKGIWEDRIYRKLNPNSSLF